MPSLSYNDFPFAGGFAGGLYENYPSLGSGADEYYSPVVASADCVNLYPEPGFPGSKSPMALIGTPGVSGSPFASVGSPCRALAAGNGSFWAVGGSSLYQISGTGSILATYSLSGSGGTGPAQILFNTNDVTVIDSSAGGQLFCVNAGTVYNPVQAISGEYIDGFYLAIMPYVMGTYGYNWMQVSNLLTGVTWNPLNYAQRTGASDFLTGVAAINGQIWLFGQKNTEVWYDAGNAVFPFQRIQGATINVGCVGRWTIAKMDNTVYWLGADDRGSYRVYRANGLQPLPISTPPVEQLISAVPGLGSETSSAVSSARAFTYSEAGHNFYVLTITGTTAYNGVTVVYDSTTGLWHRRGSYVQIGSTWYLEPIQWQCFCKLANQSGDLNLVGAANGNIYIQSITYPADVGGAAILRMRTCPHIAEENRWIKYRRFEVDADIVVASSGARSMGTITLDYSNDGGRSFGQQTGNTPVFSLAPSGAAGQGTFQKYYQMNLGRARDRVFRVQYLSSTDLVRIAGGYANVVPGSET